MPSILVEAFLNAYLNIDCVLGMELKFTGEYCTGLEDAFDYEPIMSSSQVYISLSFSPTQRV